MNIDPTGFFTFKWIHYVTNAALWSAIFAVAGTISTINLALFTSGSTVGSIIVQAFLNLKVLAAIGAIPVWGWIIMAVVAVVVIAAVAIIVKALVQGKGIMMGIEGSTRLFEIRSFSLILKVQ